MKYPRSLAVRVLTRVLSDHEPLDEALAAVQGELGGDADRTITAAWLQEVCSGTLRWKGRLDWVLDSISTKKKPSGWLRKVLLIAAYQLIAQDRTPAGRVVSETVSEVKKKEGEAPARFANACLRKISDHALSWRNLPFPASATADSPQAAAWASLPHWMWKKLVEQRGLEWSQKYALASLERPSLWLRAKSSSWEATWAERGSVPHSWKVLEGGGVVEKSGFKEGEWIVQDISSQFLIKEVSKWVSQRHPGFSALDLCAAPGGKSVGLAWSGAKVISTEIQPRRVALLKETLSRVAPEIQLLPWDQLSSLPLQDLVWVDAPCSGSGILRRHPDVRWLREEKDLLTLREEQKKAFESGYSRVRPGGYLVYSVCSVFEEEGWKQIQSFTLDGEVEKQWLIAPHDELGGDGFWACLIRKSEVSNPS